MPFNLQFPFPPILLWHIILTLYTSNENKHSFKFVNILSLLKFNTVLISLLLRLLKNQWIQIFFNKIEDRIKLWKIMDGTFRKFIYTIVEFVFKFYWSFLFNINHWDWFFPYSKSKRVNFFVFYSVQIFGIGTLLKNMNAIVLKKNLHALCFLWVSRLETYYSRST